MKLRTMVKFLAVKNISKGHVRLLFLLIPVKKRHAASHTFLLLSSHLSKNGSSI